MGGVIDDMKLDMDAVKKSVLKNSRLVESSIVLMKHINARVDALLTIGEREMNLNRAEFDTLVDTNLGLRVKTADEVVAPGDVCFVRYKGKDTVTGEEFGDELPVRIGPGVIVFENDLIGKHPGMMGYKNTYDFTDQSKVIEFTIDILKVKTRIVQEGAANGAGSGEPGSDQVESSVELEAQPLGGDNGAEQPSNAGDIQPSGSEGSVGSSGEGQPASDTQDGASNPS